METEYSEGKENFSPNIIDHKRGSKQQWNYKRVNKCVRKKTICEEIGMLVGTSFELGPINLFARLRLCGLEEERLLIFVNFRPDKFTFKVHITKGSRVP